MPLGAQQKQPNQEIQPRVEERFKIPTMVASVPSSPWSKKPASWALDAEEHDAELNELKLSDFPSLSAGATKKISKKGQTVSLVEFNAFCATERGEHSLLIPTGPRDRSAEELGRVRIGGEASSSRWGSSRVEGEKQRGFGRDLSRADEVGNWASGKKFSGGNGFQMEEKGWYSSHWGWNKGFTPPVGGRFERWAYNGVCTDSETRRPRLVLQPRTLPLRDEKHDGLNRAEKKSKGLNPFGEARPREEVLAEKGQDWKEIDEKLGSLKLKDTTERPDRSSSFGKKRGYGWRKPELVDSTSSEV